MGSFIETFLNDKIKVNGKEYGRKDFLQIAADNGCTLEDHPIVESWTTFSMKKVSINDVECDTALFSLADLLMEVITYPSVIGPYIAACSTIAKPDVYDTPLGKIADYQFDSAHKISMGPDGSMIFLWY